MLNTEYGGSCVQSLYLGGWDKNSSTPPGKSGPVGRPCLKDRITTTKNNENITNR
jgi:hypothetical protein